jgi:bifunctional non-homologous end joining protein LigD
MVPWREATGYSQALAWAKTIGGRVVSAMPERSTMERMRNKRNGRVYVDVMQNVQGQLMAPPYVLRPVPAATVSTPLAWRELTSKLDPKRFDIKSVFRRLTRQSDPIAPLARLFADEPKANKKRR